MRRIILCLAIALSTVPFPSAVEGQQSRTEEEGEIREAIVRYQIDDWDMRADVYFVEVQSKDPSAAFLRRFEDLPKPVKKKSAGKEKKDIAGFHVEDRRTKKRGVIFDQGAISRPNDSVADVEGGYRCATLCMASGIYHLERQEGKWKVTRFTIQIQS